MIATELSGAMRRTPALLAMGLALAACQSTAQRAAPPPAAAPVLAAPPPPAPGVVGVAVGQALDEQDRQAAIAAQQEAVSTGERKSWRGAHGAFGFILPGPEGAGCRDYTHKIFIDGRPQEAKGQACRRDGAWRVSG